MWTMILNGFGWVLLQLYILVENYGFAIILFALLSKIVLLPFSMKSKKSAMRMQALQPKQKALEAKYKDDKERFNLEVQKLYKTEKVNPLGGCLWQLLPWPIFIALLAVMRLPLTHMMLLTNAEVEQIASLSFISGIDMAAIFNNQLELMSQIHANYAAIISALPELSGRLVDIDFSFFGMDLAAVPNYLWLNAIWFVPVLSAGVAYLQSLVMQKMQGMDQQTQQQQSSMKFMTLLGPAMSLMIGFSWPAAMSVYWIFNGIFGIGQDWWLTLHYRKVLNIPSPAELRAAQQAEKEEQAKREAERQERLAQLASGDAPKRGTISNKRYKQLKAKQRLKTEKPNDYDTEPQADDTDSDADSESSDEGAKE